MNSDNNNNNNNDNKWIKYACPSSFFLLKKRFDRVGQRYIYWNHLLNHHHVCCVAAPLAFVCFCRRRRRRHCYWCCCCCCWPNKLNTDSFWLWSKNSNSIGGHNSWWFKFVFKLHLSHLIMSSHPSNLTIDGWSHMYNLCCKWWDTFVYTF